jgi:Heterokaryon incompatibility protein (HET)
LRRLRFEDKVRVLWIDAICINQDDREEKNQQVPLIGKIYSRTAGLLIWLGQGDDDSDRAMDLVLKFTYQLEPETDVEIRARNQALLAGYIESIAEDLTPFLAFRHLCDNKWFTRGWIVQELLLPLTEEILKDGRKSFMLTRKTLICRRKDVPWILFSRLKSTVGLHS